MPITTRPASAIPATWQSFARGALGSGAAVIARGVGALVVNKLVAVYAPTGGLTQLAQFQNLMALFTTLPSDGVHAGVVKYLAPLRPGSARARAWFGAAVALNLAVLVVGVLALAGVTQAGNYPSWGWLEVAVFAVGIVLVTGQGLVSAALLAAGRLRAYLVSSVAVALLGPAAVALGMAQGYGLDVVLLAYLAGQGLALVPALAVAVRHGVWPWRRWQFGPVSRAALRGLGQFLLMAASTLLFGKAVDYALRTHLLATYGPARTDLWQAVAKLSDNYTMVFGAVMSSVFYPRLAALAAQPRAARAYLLAVLKLLAPVLALGLGAIFLCRNWLLPLLFSPQLLGAREFLGPQLLGDWAKFLSWLFLFQLLTRARTLPYVAVQAGSAAAFAGLLAVLLPRFGLQGAVLAHAGRYGAVLLACVFVQFNGGRAK
ncbi:MAG TPA: hypothetical protein VF629_10000 [Hymenobacter sp.]|uniref:hypothetical protein n=1 Tax=Hymenobacter sp. TaxID=1898978 RepID=UPI002ED8F5D5